jgi:hypothetical protein
MNNGWLAPFATLVIIILFGAFTAEPMSSAADIAAWVQGVGSLLAIAVAIWVYQKQNSDKKADDAAETRAFVQAVYDEITTIWRGYSLNLRPQILAIDVQQGHILNVIAPMNPDALVIYNNSSARVGKVDDDALRTLIVQVYARARGFIYSIQLNNGLVIELRQFEIAYQGQDKAERINGRVHGMAQYAAVLKQHDEALEGLVARLRSAAEQWLTNHPSK